MIAAWMVYAIVVSGLLAVAGIAAERLRRTSARPARAVWLAVLVLAAGIPGWSVLAPRVPAVGSGAETASTVVFLDPLRVSLADASVLHLLDLPLVVLWVMASTVLLIRTLFGAVRLLRARRVWTRGILAGIPVLVSRDTGPAVAGVLRPAIVLPQWLLRASAADLAVAHEREHVRARDAQVLAAASLLVALMPWNPALWWSLARLRLAAEIDCDARVLSAFPERARDYCELLLKVGARGGPPLGVPALSEPPSLLERRIDTMTRPPVPPTRARTLALSSLLVIAIGGACFYPGPDDRGMADPVAVAEDITDLDAEITDGPTFTPFTVRPHLQNVEEIRDRLEREYPPLVRDAGIGGTVNVWFLISQTGRVLETQIQQSSGHPALDQAALRVAGVMEFSPALNRDEPVAVWVAFPVTFDPN